MRSNQQNKNRSRGRNGGRKNVNPLSRNFESNGPDVKIRGNAAHIAERYVQLARDATATGDSVTAENYLQHAEHYFRILSAAQAQMQPRNEPNTDFDSDDADDTPNGGNTANAGEAERASQKESSDSEDKAQADSETAEADASAEGEEERPRPRRPRRRRQNQGDEQSDPASAPQPEVGELPAFLTNNNTASAAE